MAIYAMPVVLMIEADSFEEAQKAVDDWSNEIDLGDDLPAGTEDIDPAPNCDYNDEGQRVLYLPVTDDAEELLSDGDDEEDDDDFNDSEEGF